MAVGASVSDTAPAVSMFSRAPRIAPALLLNVQGSICALVPLKYPAGIVQIVAAGVALVVWTTPMISMIPSSTALRNRAGCCPAVADPVAQPVPSDGVCHVSGIGGPRLWVASRPPFCVSHTSGLARPPIVRYGVPPDRPALTCH